jgi:hypothetical protein
MKKSTLLFREELEALYNLNHVNIVKYVVGNRLLFTIP